MTCFCVDHEDGNESIEKTWYSWRRTDVNVGVFLKAYNSWQYSCACKTIHSVLGRMQTHAFMKSIHKNHDDDAFGE